MSNTRNEKPEPDIPRPRDRPEPGEDTAIEFVRSVVRTHLSSEYGEDEEPEHPTEILDSLIREARELTGQEGEVLLECGTEVPPI